MLCNKWSLISSLAALTLLAPIGSGDARGTKSADEGHGIDTEHIFGFVEGSDTGEKGEFEAEFESSNGFGKRSGTYFVSSNEAQLKYSITDNFRIGSMLAFSQHNISNVPDLDSRNQFAFMGAGVEMRYRLLNWRTAPFGLTFSASPIWTRRDEATGEPVKQFGLELAALFDKELVKDRVFAAFNVLYEPRWTHVTTRGASEQEATFGIGGAISTQIMPGIFVGGELRYLRAYETAGLSKFAGQALFLGPTAYVTLSDRATLTLAWNAQIAGKGIGDADALDLTNFDRHQILLRFALSF